MNAIKSILSLVCLFGVLSLNAQDKTTAPTSTSKTKMTKIKVNKQATTLNKTQTKTEKQAEAKKEVNPAPAKDKKDAPTGQTKMKSINRPVKVTKK
ncbi:MAG TPA: hypothetical protein VK177_00880 [Flavobacteriales bacterium]|nr:hypothetical protein [Flavobacteriales bacterium]